MVPRGSSVNWPRRVLVDGRQLARVPEHELLRGRGSSRYARGVGVEGLERAEPARRPLGRRRDGARRPSRLQHGFGPGGPAGVIHKNQVRVAAPPAAARRGPGPRAATRRRSVRPRPVRPPPAAAVARPRARRPLRGDVRCRRRRHRRRRWCSAGEELAGRRAGHGAERVRREITGRQLGLVPHRRQGHRGCRGQAHGRQRLGRALAARRLARQPRRPGLSHRVEARGAPLAGRRN